jgi:hypothetical protein
MVVIVLIVFCLLISRRDLPGTPHHSTAKESIRQDLLTHCGGRFRLSIKGSLSQSRESTISRGSFGPSCS